MGFLKLIFKIILGIAVVLALLIGGIYTFVDPNDYKDQIVKRLNDTTGREFSIPGDIAFSVYPFLGVKLGEASVSNPETFARPVFAKINALDISLSLKQLVKFKPELGVLRLDGLEVTLIQRSDGTTNWQDLITEEVDAEQEESEDVVDLGDLDSKKKASDFVKKLKISAIDITNANINWLDEKAKNNIQIEDFNLKTGVIGFIKPIDYELSLNATIENPDLYSLVKSTGKLSINSTLNNIRLHHMKALIEAEGDSIPNKQQSINLFGNVSLDQEAQLLELNGMKVGFEEMEANVDVIVRELDKTPTIKGSVVIPKFSLAKVLSALGSDMSGMSDPEALQNVSFAAGIDSIGDRYGLKNITMNLDGSNVTGDAEVVAGKTMSIDYKFDIDDLDVDRYLAPESETEAAPVAQENTELGLPVDLIRSTNVNGGLTVKSLRVMNMSMRDIAVKNVVKNNIAQMKLDVEKIYKGQGSILASIDARKSTPAMSAEGSVTNVRVGKLLKDFMDNEFVSGKGSVDFSVRSLANTTAQLTSTLNGKVGFNLKDGEINGINIAEKLRHAEAKKEGLKYNKSREVNSTDFAALIGEGTIRNGRLNLSEMLLEAPLLRAKAKGSADIHRETLDMAFDSYFVNTKTGQAGKSINAVKSFLVPVKVKGTFTEPAITVDWKALALQGTQGKIDAGKEALKAQTQSSIQAQKDRANNARDAEKAKIEAARQAEFARLEAEKQKAEDKAEAARKKAIEDAKQKLRDKFR